MSETVEALIVDLLLWLDARERTYEEAIEAWRTSCPKLPVWEEASARGFVVEQLDGGRRVIRVTAAGHEALGKIGKRNR